MKAVVAAKYGPPEVLRYQEVPVPKCSPGQVLIRVHAVALNAADWRLLRADPWLVRLGAGLWKPKNAILGSDVAGTVTAVGPDVTAWNVGDDVVGSLVDSGLGGLAEYAVASAKALVAKPQSLSFEQAAALPMASVTALQGLRDRAQVRPGQEVLVHGALGGVGQFVVQLAVSLGARVTAVCGPRSVETVRLLGASEVLDYSTQDFTKRDQRYDVILGVNGFRPLAAYLSALKPTGRYVMVGGDSRQIFQALLQGQWYSKKGGKSVSTLTLNPATKTADLASLVGLAATGSLKVLVDRVYPLAQTQDAFRYLEQGHAQGKVIITVPAG